MARYARKGAFGEVFSDTIEGREQEEGEEPKAEGAVPVLYRTKIGPLKIKVKGWKPKDGFYVPVEDRTSDEGYRFFATGTLLAEKTLPFDRYDLAEEEFRKFGLPTDEISGFYGLDDYHGEKRVAWRDFGPGVGVLSRFDAFLEGLSSGSGGDGLASRPRWQAWMGEAEDVMEVVIDTRKIR